MSREKILQAIKQNKPPVAPLPDPPVFERDAAGALEGFLAAVDKIGGKTNVLEDAASIDSLIQTRFPNAKRIVCQLEESQLGNIDLDQIERLTDLNGLDLAIVPAQLGVVENGAVWLSEREMGPRVLPFIAEHLVVVLDRDKLVMDMHDAYRQIAIDDPGFGLFIAGPSKTADIEQSLVIGAQGPRSWLVIVR